MMQAGKLGYPNSGNWIDDAGGKTWLANSVGWKEQSSRHTYRQVVSKEKKPINHNTTHIRGGAGACVVGGRVPVPNSLRRQNKK